MAVTAGGIVTFVAFDQAPDEVAKVTIEVSPMTRAQTVRRQEPHEVFTKHTTSLEEFQSLVYDSQHVQKRLASVLDACYEKTCQLNCEGYDEVSKAR